MPAAVRAFSNLIYARWSYAGLGSAINLGGRLTSSGATAVSNFSSSFFTLSPGGAVVILATFTLVQLLVAMLLLMLRPPAETS
jgi:hypothetical protein